MEFILDIDWLNTATTKAEPKEEVKIKDILVIDEIEDGVIETLNVYDLCKTPFFYATSKVEMLSYLQSHSTDIAITKLSKEHWRDELKGICQMLGFRSSIYIVDDEGVHTSDVESWLHRHGYKVSKEGKILGFDVIEYEKGYELSIIDCFNGNYTADIFSIVFISMIPFDCVIYCDVAELVDIFYYAIKNDKNVFMPLPISDMDSVTNYLNSKVEETKKVNSDKQFELF